MSNVKRIRHDGTAVIASMIRSIPGMGIPRPLFTGRLNVD